jgi:hypothetical protein
MEEQLCKVTHISGLEVPISIFDTSSFCILKKTALLLNWSSHEEFMQDSFLLYIFQSEFPSSESCLFLGERKDIRWQLLRAALLYFAYCCPTVESFFYVF